MSTTLYPATPEMSRDEAAEILQKRKIHHAVVRNASGKFAGLLSSWDIARECALDAKVSNRRPRRPVGHPYINEARERRSSDPRLPREASFDRRASRLVTSDAFCANRSRREAFDRRAPGAAESKKAALTLSVPAGVALQPERVEQVRRRTQGRRVR